jgi:hypothetical protein
MPIGPNTFKAGHARGDYSVFLSFDTLTPAVYSPHAYEVPNVMIVDPTAYGGKGASFAIHGPSQGAAVIGHAPGGPTRGQITQCHWGVIRIPNPDWKSTTNPINGRWLGFEGSLPLMQLATSAGQGSEIWYFKTSLSGMSFSQWKLGFLRAADQIVLGTNGNSAWNTAAPYGDNTPRRPGMETMPKTQQQPIVPKWAIGPYAVVLGNDRYQPEIPRNGTGHTDHWHPAEGDPPPSWLTFDLDDYPLDRCHPVCPPNAAYGVMAAIYDQLPPEHRSLYRQMCGDGTAPAVVVPDLTPAPAEPVLPAPGETLAEPVIDGGQPAVAA